MPLVNVLINGHAYTLSCDDGEEEHLREIAKFLDTRVQELVSTVGQVGDSRLLLMAALLISDELGEAMTRLEKRDKEIAALKKADKAAGKQNSPSADEDALAETLEKAAVRIKAIAGRLTGA